MCDTKRVGEIGKENFLSLPQYPLHCIGFLCMGGSREALVFIIETVKMEFRLPVDISSYNLAPVGFYWGVFII